MSQGRGATRVGMEPEQPWAEWVVVQLEPDWRPGEWDPTTRVLTGDPDNTLTRTYRCSTRGCGNMTPSYPPRCPSCRKAKDVRGLTDAEFDAIYDPATRRSDSGKGTSAKTIRLGGLPSPMSDEVLYALQDRDRQGLALNLYAVNRGLNRITATSPDAVSLLDLDFDALADGTSKGQVVSVLRGLIGPVRRLWVAYSGEDPTLGDVWDPSLVGLRSAPDRTYIAHFGELDFTPIRLVWLREVVKSWARDVRPDVASIRRTIHATRVTAEVLAAQDHRGNPTQLSLADMTKVVDALLSQRKPTGEPYSITHLQALVYWLRRLMDYARASGLMDEVPDAFTLNASTIHWARRADRRRIDHEEVGEALPQHVISQLDRHLARLGTESQYAGGGWSPDDYAAMYQTVYQVQRDTGRRNNEVVSLPLDCLVWDEDQPILIYDNHKAGRLRRRLPIHRDTAAVIEQWLRRRASLPIPADCSTYLFPSQGARNRPRAGHVKKLTYGRIFRRWVDNLPPLLVGGLDEHGAERTLPKVQVQPYGLRHAYAQRHADAGTPVDVLRELMDHVSVETTMGYYQVSLKRKKEAVRLLAGTAIDRDGNPAAFSQPSAYELASVAVPFGNCTEPSNVKAGGKHCPIRFQCAGCSFYRPDASFLPAIEDHLVELSADRELSVTTGAAPWVTANLTEQIDAFTTVRNKLRDQLEQLTPQAREELELASQALRKARAVAFIPIEHLKGRTDGS